MNVKRLERLRDVVVPRIDRTKLDMGMWVNECGSPSCLAGWAAVDRVFKQDGLRLGKVFVHYADIGDEQQFFDLTSGQWRRLFGSDAYGRRDPTKRQMRDRINEIIAEGRKPNGG